MLKSLVDLKDCVKIEMQLKEKPIRMDENDLMNFILKKNSDFFLYYSLLSPFLNNRFKDIIFEYLRHYVVLDMILDDLTDIYLDYQNNNTNLLILELKLKNPNVNYKNYTELIAAIINHDIFKSIFSLFKKHYNSIKSLVGGLKSPLMDYLNFLADGCSEGVRLFEKYKYFIMYITDYEKHKGICQLLFKPYPWTVIFYEEIFKSTDLIKRRQSSSSEIVKY